MAFGSAQVAQIHRGFDLMYQEFFLRVFYHLVAVRSAAHFVDSVLGHEYLHVLVFVELVSVAYDPKDFQWLVDLCEERAGSIKVFLDPSGRACAFANVIPVVCEAQRVDES